MHSGLGAAIGTDVGDAVGADVGNAVAQTWVRCSRAGNIKEGGVGAILRPRGWLGVLDVA